MPRIIRIFDLADGFCVDEVPLPEISLKRLQKLFGIPKENPMYDCYIIGESEMRFFDKFVKINYEFDRYQYSLDYDS